MSWHRLFVGVEARLGLLEHHSTVLKCLAVWNDLNDCARGDQISRKVGRLLCIRTSVFVHVRSDSERGAIWRRAAVSTINNAHAAVRRYWFALCYQLQEPTGSAVHPRPSPLSIASTAVRSARSYSLFLLNDDSLIETNAIYIITLNIRYRRDYFRLPISSHMCCFPPVSLGWPWTNFEGHYVYSCPCSSNESKTAANLTRI